MTAITLTEGSQATRPKVVFVFSTRGAQWGGMLRELYETSPVFREVIAQCDREIKQHLDWSLEEKITRESESDWLDSEECIEPAIASLQLALVALWRSYGVYPDAVLSMSAGEYAAACCAGAMTIEGVIRAVCAISLMIRRRLGLGAMISVKADLEEVERVRHLIPVPFWVTAQIGPGTLILATEATDAETLISSLADSGIQCIRIPSDFAFHAPQMDDWEPEFLRGPQYFCARPAQLPIYSAVVGGLLDPAAFTTDVHYWHVLRIPALYAGAVRRSLEDGYEIYLEIGPHPILSDSIEASAALLGKQVAVLPSLRCDQPAQEVMEQTLITLRSLGYLPARRTPLA